ncbi:DUF2239 family protein [Prosthecomicrobium hirschii]|uniref:DUF2239 family protein n=1 Tax=Prosthecodimorpha hirschii TaxID=665126 RepID=UPI00221F7216|nr:DUF2239 family protein [Prosthecomicrobium hirschii]MCW1840268.1 DUF2239 family protein [Prosthecomicrobium hirschii]
MTMTTTTTTAAATVTAFLDGRRLAAGPRAVVAQALAALSAEGQVMALVFDDRSGAQVDLDLSGGPEAIAARYAEVAPASGAPDNSNDETGRAGTFDEAGKTGAFDEAGKAGAFDEAGKAGRGRPKLGVVAREITLLPRHWDWLASQPGGASVVLRKLVDRERKQAAWDDMVRDLRAATQRFMTAMAGDLPGYEEASRALYAGDHARFVAETEAWPADIRDHARRLAEGAVS